MINAYVFINCSNMWISNNVWEIVWFTTSVLLLKISQNWMHQISATTKWVTSQVLDQSWLPWRFCCVGSFYFNGYFGWILLLFAFKTAFRLIVQRAVSPGVIRLCHLPDLDWGEIGINSCSYLLSNLKLFLANWVALIK